MKASEVATTLRAIADGLDKVPETEFHAFLSFSVDEKEPFKTLASIWPRPCKKQVQYPGTNYEDVLLVHEFARLTIPRNKVCEIVEPAKPAVYRCEPLLSDDEIEEVSQ